MRPRQPLKDPAWQRQKDKMLRLAMQRERHSREQEAVSDSPRAVARARSASPGVGGLAGRLDFNLSPETDCPNCGTLYTMDSLFCHECGERRQGRPSKSYPCCWNCDAVALPDSRFCPWCGAALSDL
eukprot:TRINITY_DN19419_c0_g1_i1.p3 TRINITY_DN19419_c0_g1~~TRINITY_DN19419_c0_g1_i1.p3  ORF type:complete len:127 (-),score=15.73 TRINITY_DN19419_c0_g1_i1:20-400(-)